MIAPAVVSSVLGLEYQAVAAYDRKTGKKAWAAGDQPAGYSSAGRMDGGAARRHLAHRRHHLSSETFHVLHH